MDKLQNLNRDRSQDIHLRSEPGGWGSVFLAGVPHLIMGLLIGLGLTLRFSLFDTFQKGYEYPGFILILIVVCTLVVAWLNHWPLWSASWYFYGGYLSLALIAYGIELLDLEDSWRFINILWLSWLVFCILSYFLIVSRSRMHGLLSMVIFFPLMGTFFVEFVPNQVEGVLAIITGTITAITSSMIVRFNNFRQALMLLIGMNLFIGLLVAYVGEYQVVDFPQGIPAHVPVFGDFLEILGLYSAISIGVIAFPILMKSVRNHVKRNPTT